MAQTPEEKAAAKAAKEAEKEAAKAAKEAEQAAAKAAKEAAAGGAITVRFRDHQGQPTERTFSKEDHGDNFAELAAEFRATNATRIIE